MLFLKVKGDRFKKNIPLPSIMGKSLKAIITETSALILLGYSGYSLPTYGQIPTSQELNKPSVNYDSNSQLEEQVREASNHLKSRFYHTHDSYQVSKETWGSPWRHLRAEFSNVYDVNGEKVVESRLSFEEKKHSKIPQSPFNRADFIINPDGSLRSGSITKGGINYDLNNNPTEVKQAYVLALAGVSR